MHELRRECEDNSERITAAQPSIDAYQRDITKNIKVGLCKYRVCCFPAARWAFSPQTDRIVISSRAPSSPSPRAHKSSWSAVTSARPRGPGWHSVFHYILVSLAERHNPTAFPCLFMEPILMYHLRTNNPHVQTQDVCFIGQVAPWSGRALSLDFFLLPWELIFKWLLYLQTRTWAHLSKWLLVMWI